MKEWKFYYEDEKVPEFTIQAPSPDEAYDLAYESYGPQVKDMFYQRVSKEKKEMKAKEIINIIAKDYLLKKNHPVVVENCRWNMHYEADVVSINNSNFITEFEIKISRSDFKADFRYKDHKHYFLQNGGVNYSPNYFYFVTPPNLIKENEIPQKYGWISVDDNGKIVVLRKAKLLHKEKVIQRYVFKILTVAAERLLLGCAKVTYMNKGN